MARTILNQKDLTNAGNSGVQTCKLDVGLLFHGLVIHANTGVIKIADFDKIEYLINGTIYMSLTGEQLDAINQYDGLQAADGTKDFVLPFDLVCMKDQRMREMTAVNTGIKSPNTGKIISNHTLRMTMAAGPAGSVDLSVFADVEPNTPDGPGVVRRFSPYNKTSVVGTTKFSDFDYANPQFAYWRRIFTQASAGSISSAQVSSPKAIVYGENVPTSSADMLGVNGGHPSFLTLGVFQSIVDFTLANSGYTAQAKAELANPQNPNDKTLVVKPDTPNIPFLDTFPFKDTTLSLSLVNTNAGDNAHILEAIGDIE